MEQPRAQCDDRDVPTPARGRSQNRRDPRQRGIGLSAGTGDPGGAGNRRVISLPPATTPFPSVPCITRSAMASTSTKPRILTGDTPTGKLHLGHYVGSVENRIALQDQYDCYFIIANK